MLIVSINKKLQTTLKPLIWGLLNKYGYIMKYNKIILERMDVHELIHKNSQTY